MVTTNFFPVKGNWKMTQLQMIASVAIAEGAAIYAVGDGTHTKVTASTANFKGILLEPITAADADYATSKKLKYAHVAMDDTAEAEFTVGSGTFTNDDVGKSVKFYDEVSVAVDTAGTQLAITGYKSASRGLCKFNRAIS